jgi:hypothetical protein
MTADLSQIARHEAAHAVIAFVEGVRFRVSGVSIIPQKTGRQRSAGRVGVKGNCDLHKLLRTVLAGPLYELITLPEPSEQAMLAHASSLTQDAKDSATILADLWNCPANQPLGRALQLPDWTPFNDAVGERVLLRVHKKKARAACFFLDSFLYALWLSDRTPADANKLFAKLNELREQQLKDTHRDANNSDPRAFPFLHQSALYTRRLVVTHRDTIEALAECLLQKQALSGPDLESFLTTHQTTEQK